MRRAFSIRAMLSVFGMMAGLCAAGGRVTGAAFDGAASNGAASNDAASNDAASNGVAPSIAVLPAAVAPAAVVSAVARSSAPAVAKPLLAWWRFDEAWATTCRDSSGRGHDAQPVGSSAGIRRIDGLLAGALELSESHQLQAVDHPDFARLKHIGFSAWVMPSAFAQYNEIFRKEDGMQRLLFSFQEKGTILSLGLNVSSGSNVGGYIECDAPIKPESVLDGRWHHCAAAFDGRWMRVYLDGREIGKTERPGAIVAGGTAPACIGSTLGGECFHGAIDDLRIYSEAIDAADVAAIYREGYLATEQLAQAAPDGEPSIDKRLLAHWTFNERLGGVLHGTPSGKNLDIRLSPGVGRTRGVHGAALDLRGEPKLAVAGLPEEGCRRLSFSAWVRPTDLSGYREIFRQECPDRLLFAFQGDGTILSLGLNVGGYEELDATIQPAAVLDGLWHHCVGTFDGHWMRVYLDGRPIGALQRKGTLRMAPGVPAFVGSSGGATEFFQGGLDDLRIYADALSADDVGKLFQAGRVALRKRLQDVEKAAGSVYSPAPDFARTLAATRRKILQQSMQPDREMVAALLGRLRESFPKEFADFSALTGVSPIEFLVAPDLEFQKRHAQRLLDLASEYKPLTERQWSKQTPEDRRRWEDVARLEKRYADLVAAGHSARFSPEWIALIFEAGRKVQLRPYVSEAVAPYLKPSTPPTRSLSAEEGNEALHRDWLHQADGNPTPQRIAQEIAWTRQLAARIASQGPHEVDLAASLAALAPLEEAAQRAKKTPGASDRELYFRVRELKRRIVLKSPAIHFNKVLLVDMPYPQGSEWQHETRHRLGYMAVPGGRLLVLEGLSPAGKVRPLAPQAPLHGTFWRPDLAWDGSKVLFCFKPHNEKAFHLYEVNADGTGFVQLTDGPYDDLDPIYLPDGHILFSTTRGHTYVRCMPPTNAFVLGRCDADGKNVYLVSYNNEPDYLSSVMNDGRVIYTRWEYTDKPLWRAQKLWTMNPDGTQVLMYWGNQSVWPDLMKDARAIPGSRRVMFTGSAHHNWFAGSVGIIDPDRGYNYPDGLTKVTGDMAWPESGDGPRERIESPRYHASGTYGAYYSPYPLSEKEFLVSADRGGKFLLYWMDVDGNRELIYEGVHNVLHAMPLAPRARPPMVADRVAWPTREQRNHPKDGVIFSANVYQGAPAELRNKARYLRVLNIDPKTYTYWYKRPYISTGPVVSAVQSEGVKRILGTVPIEPDGSVAFHAPSGTALHFQLLDENGLALQTMRSFVGVMPGERRGCLGCHESHSRTPESQIGRGSIQTATLARPAGEVAATRAIATAVAGVRAPIAPRGLSAGPLALLKEPQRIVPPPWSDTTVSYPRYVQPVLDRYCGKCHQGVGEARKVFDMTQRPTSPIFTEPYWTLIGRPSWGEPYVRPKNPPPGFGIADTILVEGFGTLDPKAYATPVPMQFLSFRSRLIDQVSSGKHYGVKVDEVSRQRLIAWVDAMCPYMGEEEIRAIPDPEFQGVDWISVRPRIQTAPNIIRPGPVD